MATTASPWQRQRRRRSWRRGGRGRRRTERRRQRRRQGRAAATAAARARLASSRRILLPILLPSLPLRSPASVPSSGGRARSGPCRGGATAPGGRRSWSGRSRKEEEEEEDGEGGGQEEPRERRRQRRRPRRRPRQRRLSPVLLPFRYRGPRGAGWPLPAARCCWFLCFEEERGQQKLVREKNRHTMKLKITRRVHYEYLEELFRSAAAHGGPRKENEALSRRGPAGFSMSLRRKIKVVFHFSTNGRKKKKRRRKDRTR